MEQVLRVMILLIEYPPMLALIVSVVYIPEDTDTIILY